MSPSDFDMESFRRDMGGKVFILIVGVLLLWTIPTVAAKSYGDFDSVVFHSCYDGDTCRFSIPSVHPLLGDEINIRIEGIDTPEIRGKCESEKRLAIEARDYLVGILKAARKVRLVGVSRGKYFRIVAKVEADGVDVGEVLVGRGLAVVYDGGTKSSWCE